VILALLLDLDDTLYEYGPCEAAGRDALRTRFFERFGTEAKVFDLAFAAARKSVKDRCPSPSGHSRLLYVHELLHVLAGPHPPRLSSCRELEDVYWTAYLDAANLRSGAIELLETFRARGGKIAIVTDLTLDIQLRKLEVLALFDHLDALVASEEVGTDKPSRAPFELASARLGVSLESCAVIGDNVEKDGEGAKTLGIPFFHAKTLATGIGLTLEQILLEIFRRNAWTT
jgi:HAD superfamily hydrolase (TIGR01549 family)